MSCILPTQCFASLSEILHSWWVLLVGVVAVGMVRVDANELGTKRVALKAPTWCCMRSISARARSSVALDRSCDPLEWMLDGESWVIPRCSGQGSINIAQVRACRAGRRRSSVHMQVHGRTCNWRHLPPEDPDSISRRQIKGTA